MKKLKFTNQVLRTLLLAAALAGTTNALAMEIPNELQGQFELDSYEFYLIPDHPPILHGPAVGSTDLLEIGANGNGKRIYIHSREGKSCRGESPLRVRVREDGGVEFQAGAAVWSGDMDASQLCGGRKNDLSWSAKSYKDLGWAIEFHFDGKMPVQTFARLPRLAAPWSESEEGPFWFEETP